MRTGEAREVWVAGLPGDYGGASTELDHFATLLRDDGIRVHIVPVPSASPGAIAAVTRRGYEVTQYADDVFAAKVVVAFCNTEFLLRLPSIVYHGRPRAVVWFSCMADLFALEPPFHEAGWLDYFGFASEYQRRRVEPELSRIRPVRRLDYRPYLDSRRFRWCPRRDPSSFHIGRVSRDDALKFPSNMWITFDNVRVPAGVTKRAFVLGYGAEAAAKTGPPPPWLDTVLWPPRAVDVSVLYSNIDVLIYETGGWVESYCRVVVEAYASGVVPVVQRDFAFPELVKHGETGFLASTSAELSEYATWLAHHHDHRLVMAENGREHLDRCLIDAEASLRGIRGVIDDVTAAAP